MDFLFSMLTNSLVVRPNGSTLIVAQSIIGDYPEPVKSVSHPHKQFPHVFLILSSHCLGVLDIYILKFFHINYYVMHI